MRIMVVANNLLAGGAERVIVQLLKEWTAGGVECSLVLMKKQQHFYELPEKVQLFELEGNARIRALNKLKKLHRVRQIAKQISPDVVLSMPEEIGIYVIGALLGTGIPVVVSERNNPWVMPYKKVTRLLRRMLYPFAAGLIFQTRQAASFFSPKLQRKGIVLPNPLDLTRIPKPYDGEREKIVVSAGRLEPQKNFRLLIDAFSDIHQTHPEYRLVIYGEGSLRKELETYAGTVLAEGVVSLPGRVTDLPERMRTAAAFALSSDFEGVPNVLIEALAMGIPSVSTDCAPGGAAELIENGKNGFLVPIGDREQLAVRLAELLDCAEQSASFSKVSTDIKERLDSHFVCENWLKYLKEVANENYD